MQSSIRLEQFDPIRGVLISGQASEQRWLPVRYQGFPCFRSVDIRGLLNGVQLREKIAQGNLLADFGDPLLDPAASTKRHVAFNTRPKLTGQQLRNRAGNDTGDHNSNAYGRIFGRSQPRFTSEHQRQDYNK
ncbi:hypothetical protein SH139x_003190 [Planctomycetaceae bacterium SH139]